MGRKRRRSNVRWDLIGLGVLSICTAGIVSAAILQGPEPAPVNAAPIAPVVQTEAPAKAPAAPLTAEQIRALIASGEPVTISVLGDSTGDAEDEWVSLWADHLAVAHTVRYFLWNDTTQSYPTEPRVKGNGPMLTIWNGSRAGSTPKYAADRYGVIQPQKPGIIIYNYGHNNKDAGAVDELKALSAKVAARYGTTPSVITLQNPAQGTRTAQTENSVNVLRAYAAGSGLPVIDVYTAMTDLPPRDILKDEVHPNPQGSQVWADTVIATLG